VDGYQVNRIVGTKALCAALEKARRKAKSLSFGLLLWDGYRPQRATDSFLHWSNQPEDSRTKLRYYPNIEKTEIFKRGYVATKSDHSRGSAIDLTLYHLVSGGLTPMGGGHDLMDPISHHEAQEISLVETMNRQRLRSIMTSCGFRPYDCEWWHYTLEDEPYPDTYFDFPIA
jgi:D-alanyl-D-alanine dipeptidase